MKRKFPKRADGLHSPTGAELQFKGVANLELRLLTILNNLARVLIASGYGISGVNRLVKHAFLNAARDIVFQEGHKQSKSSIAAITGLTRTEVTQLLRHTDRSRGKDFTPASRIQRVAYAWMSDAAYCDNSGRPRVLPFTGAYASFRKLVKAYSGDIPARAMLSEMSRLGIAREESNGKVRLVNLGFPPSHQSITTLRAMAPWVEFLAEASDEARALSANTIRLTLSFGSLPQLFAAVRDLQSRANAFVASINELAGPRSSAKHHNLQVTIALATRVPQPKKTRGRKKTEAPDV
jgi:hypothetical protein